MTTQFAPTRPGQARPAVTAGEYKVATSASPRCDLLPPHHVDTELVIFMLSPVLLGPLSSPSSFVGRYFPRKVCGSMLIL